MKALRNTIAALAIAYTLAVPSVYSQTDTIKPGALMPISIKTNSDIQINEKRKGAPSQRIEMTNDYWRFRTDIKTDVRTDKSTPHNLCNATTFELKNIVNNDALAVHAEVDNDGNFDGKDYTYFGAMLKTKGATKFSAVAGRGFSREKPRDFMYASIEDVAVSDDVKAMADMQIFSYAPMYKKSKKNVHALAAAYGQNWFALAGKQIRALHGIVGINNLKDFGFFGWHKYDAEDGSFIGRYRVGIGNADQEYFNSAFEKSAGRENILPNFYPPHFGPSESRADISLGVDLNGDRNYMTMRLLPGFKTGVGFIGLGSETCWKNDVPNTGARIGYYNSVKLENPLGINVKNVTLSVEANASLHLNSKPAYDGYITLNYTR